MNQDTLVLLSGMAPKEPEQWALDEWGAKFEADYPKPWEPTYTIDLYIAGKAACLAGYHAGFFSEELADLPRNPSMRDLVRAIEKKSPWHIWRRECLAEFTRNEWPLLWAKKRMQAAANKQHKADER